MFQIFPESGQKCGLDPEKQKQFVKDYEELKKNLKEDEEIYFVDAVHPQHQSEALCGWIKKGETKTLQTTGKQLRLHFAGAINLSGLKCLMQEHKTVDAEAMIDFFKKLYRLRLENEFDMRKIPTFALFCIAPILDRDCFNPHKIRDFSFVKFIFQSQSVYQDNQIKLRQTIIKPREKC